MHGGCAVQVHYFIWKDNDFIVVTIQSVARKWTANIHYNIHYSASRTHTHTPMLCILCTCIHVPQPYSCVSNNSVQYGD